MLTFTKSMLALSVMAAVGGVNAATYTENTTLADKIFTQSVTAIERASEILCPWDNRSPPNGCIQ